MVPCSIYDQGHFASVQLNWCVVTFLSSLGHKPLVLKSSALQQFIILSRDAASSLYAGLVYLGCWTNGMLFHQSLKAWFKERIKRRKNIHVVEVILNKFTLHTWNNKWHKIRLYFVQRMLWQIIEKLEQDQELESPGYMWHYTKANCWI